ncbi:unnamed protein product [Symbiodinium sp. CCMP2592]|nr:unnamed protein product [Symbiodinium sp. CCMP2592]
MPDLRGKVAFVTGASSGIGLETARQLALANASVLVGCRDEGKCQHAFAGLQQVEILKLDLTDLRQVEQVASQLERLPALHILVNNAGVATQFPHKLTQNGIETTFQANYLGHFLLSTRLLPLLQSSSPSRLVHLTSGAHRGAPVEGVPLSLEGINDKDAMGPYARYGAAKLANLIFSQEINRRFGHLGVYSNAVHPGVVATEMLRLANFEALGGHGLGCSRSSEDLEEAEEDSAGADPRPHPRITIIDMKQRWVEVTFHVFLAACCLIPVVGLFCSLFLFYKYGLRKPSGSRPYQGGFLHHSWVWISLFGTPLANLWTFSDYLREGVRHRSLDLESILGLLQRTLLRDALSLGAGIAMIILECQYEAVTEGLKRFKQKGQPDSFSDEAGDLPKDGVSNRLDGQDESRQLYDELLKRLREKFPTLYEGPEGTDSKLELSTATGWTAFAIQIMSSLLTFFLVLMLQIEESATFYLKPCEGCTIPIKVLGREEPLPTSRSFCVVTFYVVCVTTYTWYRFLGKVLNMTYVEMKENRLQLLVFTALTRADAFNMLWSSGNLDSLRKILQCEGGEDEQSLRKELAERLRTETLERLEFGSSGACLDLQKTHHAEAWWKLRTYIQKDFVDETVVVEIIGVIIFMLMLLFSVVSLLNWLENHSWSFPLTLLFLLISILFYVLWQVFEECVAINILWESDNRILSVATLKAMRSACRSKDPRVMERHASLLRAMQNKVAVFDNRQELFGLAVTRNLRNGWVLTASTLMLSFALQIAEPLILNGLLRQHLEGLLDLIDGMFNNAALNLLFCAASPEVELRPVRGKLIVPIATEHPPRHAQAFNDEFAIRLWEFSQKLVTESLAKTKSE